MRCNEMVRLGISHRFNYFLYWKAVGLGIGFILENPGTGALMGAVVGIISGWRGSFSRWQYIWLDHFQHSS